MQSIRLHLLSTLLVAVLALWAGSTSDAALGAETNSAAKKAEPAQTNRAGEDGLDPENLPAIMDMTLEELLNDPAGAAPNVAAERCMKRFSGYSTEILDPQHLLFKSSTGRRAWLNRLPNECIGLRPSMALVFESTGSRRCAHDTVYGFLPSLGPVQTARSARCRLGKFEPITLEHALALEETFAQRSKALAEERRQERKAKRDERKRKRREAREARRQKRAAASE